MELHTETEQFLASLTTAIEHHRQNGGDYVGIWNRASGVVDNLVRSNASLRAQVEELEGDYKTLHGALGEAQKRILVVAAERDAEKARATRAEARVEKLERVREDARDFLLVLMDGSTHEAIDEQAHKLDAALAECGEGE